MLNRLKKIIQKLLDFYMGPLTIRWNEVMRCDMEAEGKIEIPEGVTGIFDAVFNGCYKITSVVIPESMRNIGAEAFCGCRRLMSVIILGNIDKIALCVFKDCSALNLISISGKLKSYDGLKALEDHAPECKIIRRELAFLPIIRHSLKTVVLTPAEKGFVGLMLMVKNRLRNSNAVVNLPDEIWIRMIKLSRKVYVKQQEVKAKDINDLTPPEAKDVDDYDARCLSMERVFANKYSIKYLFSGS